MYSPLPPYIFVTPLSSPPPTTHTLSVWSFKLLKLVETRNDVFLTLVDPGGGRSGVATPLKESKIQKGGRFLTSWGQVTTWKVEGGCRMKVTGGGGGNVSRQTPTPNHAPTHTSPFPTPLIKFMDTTRLILFQCLPEGEIQRHWGISWREGDKIGNRGNIFLPGNCKVYYKTFVYLGRGLIYFNVGRAGKSPGRELMGSVPSFSGRSISESVNISIFHSLSFWWSRMTRLGDCRWPKNAFMWCCSPTVQYTASPRIMVHSYRCH